MIHIWIIIPYMYIYIYKYMYIYTYLNDIASIYTNGNDPYFNVLFTHILWKMMVNSCTWDLLFGSLSKNLQGFFPFAPGSPMDPMDGEIWRNGPLIKNCKNAKVHHHKAKTRPGTVKLQPAIERCRKPIGQENPFDSSEIFRFFTLQRKGLGQIHDVLHFCTIRATTSVALAGNWIFTGLPAVAGGKRYPLDHHLTWPRDALCQKKPSETKWNQCCLVDFSMFCDWALKMCESFLGSSDWANTLFETTSQNRCEPTIWECHKIWDLMGATMGAAPAKIWNPSWMTLLKPGVLGWQSGHARLFHNFW